MRLIDAQQKLLLLKQPILETSDVGACLGVSIATASQILKRLSKAGSFLKIAKGKWATTHNIDPFVLPEYLTSPFPSYISLQSALYYHGIISQIPNVVYAASIARTSRHSTPLGTVSIHHFEPNFFFGFELIPKTNIKMATPEKAILDMLYLFPARSKLFKSWPEIELPNNLNLKLMHTWIKKINSNQRKALVQKKLALLAEKNRSINDE